MHPNREWVEKRNIRDLPGIADVADRILAERGDPIALQFTREGELLESGYIPELEWFLLVEQSEDVLMADIRYNLFRNLLFGFLISCLVILINSSFDEAWTATARAILRKPWWPGWTKPCTPPRLKAKTGSWLREILNPSNDIAFIPP